MKMLMHHVHPQVRLRSRRKAQIYGTTVPNLQAVPHLLTNRVRFLADKQSILRQNHEAKIFMFNDMTMFSSNVKAPHKG